MKQITSNVWVETEVRGCNFGFVTTSDGIVMIDSPHKPSTAMWLKAESEKRSASTGSGLRYIINTEPHGDQATIGPAMPSSMRRSSPTREFVSAY